MVVMVVAGVGSGSIMAFFVSIPLLAVILTLLSFPLPQPSPSSCTITVAPSWYKLTASSSSAIFAFGTKSMTPFLDGESTSVDPRNRNEFSLLWTLYRYDERHRPEEKYLFRYFLFLLLFLLFLLLLLLLPLLHRGKENLL